MHHRVKNLAQSCICETSASTLHVHLFLSSDIWIILILFAFWERPLIRTMKIHRSVERGLRSRFILFLCELITIGVKKLLWCLFIWTLYVIVVFKHVLFHYEESFPKHFVQFFRRVTNMYKTNGSNEGRGPERQKAATILRPQYLSEESASHPPSTLFVGAM